MRTQHVHALLHCSCLSSAALTMCSWGSFKGQEESQGPVKKPRKPSGPAIELARVTDKNRLNPARRAELALRLRKGGCK